MEAERTARPRLASRYGAPARVSAVLSSTWTLGGLVFAVTWAGGLVPPFDPLNIDSSAHAGLQMAATQRLDFGSEIVFTYGPLGFLHVPELVYPTTLRIAFAYALAIHAALAITCVAVLRPTFRLLPAAAVALLLAALAGAACRPSGRDRSRGAGPRRRRG